MNENLTGRRLRGPSPQKARKMLHDNSAQGRPLTGKQRGLFGLIASGKTPTQTKTMRRKRAVKQGL